MQRKIGRVSLDRLAGMSSVDTAMYSSSTYPTNRLVPVGLKPTGFRVVRRHQSSPAYAMIEDTQLDDPEEDYYSAEHDDRGMTYAAGMDDFPELEEIEAPVRRRASSSRAPAAAAAAVATRQAPRAPQPLSTRQAMRDSQRTPQQISRAQAGALRRRAEPDELDDLEELEVPRARSQARDAREARRTAREELARPRSSTTSSMAQPPARRTTAPPEAPEISPEWVDQVDLQALAIRLMAFQSPATANAARDEAAGWTEQEIVPGLRISVRQGVRWKAEQLDTGQILLTPATAPVAGVGEVGVGALLRDTDGFSREIDDPRPQRGGRRW